MPTDARSWSHCHLIASGLSTAAAPVAVPPPEWLRSGGLAVEAVNPLNALARPDLLRKLRIGLVPCLALEGAPQGTVSYPLPLGPPDSAAWQALAERVALGDAYLNVAPSQGDAAEVAEVAQYLSHDLRGPVRNSARLLELLLESAPLDGATRTSLERVRSSMHDAANRIDALVQFLRIGQANLSPTLLDGCALSSQLLGELGETFAPAQRTLDVAPGMSVTGDLQLVTLALRQLLDNACKFSRHVAAPEVRVRLHAVPGFDVIEVADNGVGFSAVHAQSLFRPFERIHLQSEFPGSGIGLALVRRVAERHGGWSWADVGTPGWTRFLLALPAAKRDD